LSIQTISPLAAFPNLKRKNVFGNIQSDLEDLAFLIRPSREVDEIGRRVCLKKLRPVESENMPLLPQRVKSGSVSGFALLTSSVRNHARSAFKRFSPHCPSLICRGGKERTGVKNLKGAGIFPENIPIYLYYYKFENAYSPLAMVTLLAYNRKHEKSQSINRQTGGL